MTKNKRKKSLVADGEKYITINELNAIIAKHFGKKYCNTVECEIATLFNQHNPEVFKLGGGSVLTIKFYLEGELQP